MTKLCKDFGFGELKGSNTLSLEKPDDNDTLLDDSGQRRHRQLLGRLLWLDRPDTKNAVCQLSTHVGTATTRDEITDADWAGDVKDRRSCSGIAVWVKSSVENTWYPVYASSKKQNLVCWVQVNPS